MRGTICNHLARRYTLLRPHTLREKILFPELGHPYHVRLASMSQRAEDSTVLRPSASLIVVNPKNEILLVRRNVLSTSFADVHVFPGGNFDLAQDTSLEMTAIRETFEETGLLLASSSDPIGFRPKDDQIGRARESARAQKMLFHDFLSDFNLTPDIASIQPFTEWITPLNMPKRYRTQFYIAFLADATSSGFSEGFEEFIPTPDGGEVLAAFFMHPKTILADYRAHKIGLMPPQFYLLTTLAELLSEGRTTPSEREKVDALAKGAFGRMLMQPQMISHEGAGIMYAYAGDEAVGGPKTRLHRCLFVKRKVGGEMTLYRNFDLFKDIEGSTNAVAAKL